MAEHDAADDTRSPLERWLDMLRLTEPVRLYLYGLLVVAVPGLVLAGAITGEWGAYLIGAAATVLGIGGATEAARSSAWSTRSVAQAMSAAVGNAHPSAAYQEALTRFQAMADDGVKRADQ